MAGKSAGSEVSPASEVDLLRESVRDLNALLHRSDLDGADVRVLNPDGRHSVAAGIDQEAEVTVDGHVGYYCAAMNQRATVRVLGNAGAGLAENMMSGTVLLEGDASQAAGASARGGRLVIQGNAAARCGISMKGADIVVGGSIGHAGAFMAQRGRLVVLGDAGPGLGDSLYEAEIFVRGTAASLGSDCRGSSFNEAQMCELGKLLDAAGFADVDPGEFTRYESERRLYNFDVDNASLY